MTEQEAIKFQESFFQQIDHEKGKEACALAIKALEEVEQYRKIGTIDACWMAMEKQQEKRPRHISIKHGKHKWCKNEDDQVAKFGQDMDSCYNVICTICGKIYGVNSDIDFVKIENFEDCEENYLVCPTCGKKICSTVTHCNCGQKLKQDEQIM